MFASFAVHRNDSAMSVWLPAAIALAALAAQTFASGRLAVAPAVFAAPVLLLLLVDSLRPRISLGLVYVALLVAFVIQWRGYIPAPWPIYIAVSVGYALLGWLPYALHAALCRGVAAPWRVLVFPAGLVLTEIATRVFSPYGSWGATAYALPGWGALGSLASVAGLTAAALAVGWVASFATWVFSGGHRQHPRWALAMLAGFLACWALGSWHARTAPVSPTVATSTIHVPLAKESIIFGDIDWVGERGQPIRTADALFRDIFLLNKRVPEELQGQVRAWFQGVQDELLAATAREIEAGARLVVWSEANGVVLAEDASSFVHRVRELARRTRAVIVMTQNVKTLGQDLSDNRALVIDANGYVLTTYRKARPVPGAEASLPGDGKVPVVDTAIGRLALVICFDADHPELVRAAAVGGAQVLIVPSYDWDDITPYHTWMAAWRASELGLPIVRSASSGESAVFDARGQLVTHQRADASSPTAMRAQAPVGRVDTLYARTGDAPWAAAAAAVLMVVAVIRWRRRRS